MNIPFRSKPGNIKKCDRPECKRAANLQFAYADLVFCSPECQAKHIAEIDAAHPFFVPDPSPHAA